MLLQRMDTVSRELALLVLVGMGDTGLAEQFDLPASGVPMRSEVLFRNVMLSEIWDATTTRSDQIRWFNSSIFAMDADC